MTENDIKKIKTRPANLEKLKEKLNDLKLNRERLKKYRLDRRQKLDALDEITRKKVTGKETPEPVRPQKIDSDELIETVFRIAISVSATHERRHNEVLRTVKTFDKLKEALSYEGYDLKRSSIYFHLLPRIF